MNNLSQSRTVQIVPNKKTGQIISISAKAPEFGYINVIEEADNFTPGWAATQKKSTIIRAKTATLQRLIVANPSLMLPGKIVTQEYTENDIPDNLVKAFLSNKGLTLNEQLHTAAKRPYTGGPILMSGDERIIRFAWYENTTNTPDIKVDHDNAIEAPSSSSKVHEAEIGALLNPTPIIPVVAPVIVAVVPEPAPVEPVAEILSAELPI